MPDFSKLIVSGISPVSFGQAFNPSCSIRLLCSVENTVREASANCNFSAAKSRDIASSLPSASTMQKFILRCGGIRAKSHASLGGSIFLVRFKNEVSASVRDVSAADKSRIPSTFKMYSINSLTVSGTGTSGLRKRCGRVLITAATFSRSMPITSHSNRAGGT